MGLVVTYALFAALEKLGLYRQAWPITWSSVTACFLALSFWQAMLLVPTWRRKLLWMGAFLVAALPLLYYKIRLPYWYDPVHAAPVLQASVLVGARKRAWLWFLVAVVGVGTRAPQVHRIASESYDLLARLLRPFASIRSIVDSFDAQQMISLSILGATAAFLMSPVESGDRRRDDASAEPRASGQSS